MRSRRALRIAAFVALAAAPLAVTEEGRADVSLENARSIQAIQGVLARAEREVGEACKTTVAIVVDWDSFGNERRAILGVTSGGVTPAADALKGACVDDLGRQRVAHAVHQIALRYVADPSKRRLALAAGVLALEAPFGGDAKDTFSTERVRIYIEKTL